MEWEGYSTDGWKRLLRASRALERRYGIEISHKEKFAGLRLWPHFTDSHPSDAEREEIGTFCALIESQSHFTCQVCGTQGSMHFHRMPEDRWFMNLCDGCVRRRIRFVMQKRSERPVDDRKRYHHVPESLRHLCLRFVEDLANILPLLAEEHPDTASRFSSMSLTMLTGPRNALTAKRGCEEVLEEYMVYLKAIVQDLQDLPTQCNVIEE